MSGTTTLEAVRQQVLNRKAKLRDDMVASKTLLLDGDRLVVRNPSGGEQSYAMDGRVYGQLCNAAYGMPGSLMRKLTDESRDDANPALAAELFNHFINVGKQREVMLRFRKDKEGNDVVRAMLSGTWNPIPYEDSIATLESKFGPDHEVKVTRFDDNELVLDFVTKQLNYETNPNIHVMLDDPVEWGMRFRDSDSGMGNCLVSPYTRRLVCTNGMTTLSHGLVMSISHSGKQSADLLEAQSNVRQGIEMVDGYAHRIAELITASQGVTLDIDNETNWPIAAVSRIAKDNNVTRLQNKHVYQAWDKEKDTIAEPSAWRLHNAYTRAGTHAEELTEDQRLQLQAVGGRVLELAGNEKYSWS